MGSCFSSPAADGAAPPAKKAGGSSAAHHGGSSSAAAKSRVPDFGLGDYWEVIKLLGTGGWRGAGRRARGAGPWQRRLRPGRRPEWRARGAAARAPLGHAGRMPRHARGMPGHAGRTAAAAA
jgi:hypothetical protein